MAYSGDDLEQATGSPDIWRSFVERNNGSLVGRDFSGLFLEGLDFSKLDLEECVFNQADIRSCDFSRSNLYGSSLASASISSSNFTGAMLTGVDFYDCEIVDSDFALSELSLADSRDASFDGCDFSRSRGVSQKFLDDAVGNSRVVIPQSLDYPDHWLRSDEEIEEQEYLQRLRSFRGDEVLLCQFNGNRLTSEQVAERERAETRSALDFLQRRLHQLLDDKFLHNEAPKVFRALQDYYETITQNAGEGNARWPKKLYEIDEIRVGLEGSSLSAYVESERKEITACAPESIPIIEQIVQSHFLLVGGGGSMAVLCELVR